MTFNFFTIRCLLCGKPANIVYLNCAQCANEYGGDKTDWIEDYLLVECKYCNTEEKIFKKPVEE